MTTIMKLSYERLQSRIAIGLFALMLASPSWAQSLPANNTTNFPMIGLVRGQTLQINLVAYPPGPFCFAQLGFQNSSGNPVGPTLNVTLGPGQSASLPLNGDTLTNVPGERIEVLQRSSSRPAQRPASVTLQRKSTTTHSGSPVWSYLAQPVFRQVPSRKLLATNT